MTRFGRVVIAAVALALPTSAVAAPPEALRPAPDLAAVVEIPETFCWVGDYDDGPAGLYSWPLPEFDVPARMQLSNRDVCKPVRATIADRRVPLHRAAVAWEILAHEYAHHLGYDHGEETIGATCAGYRNLRTLMIRAGVREETLGKIRRRVASFGPCNGAGHGS